MQTLSIKIPDSVTLPKELSQDILQFLLVGFLRSKGLITDADVMELTGHPVAEFEERLADYEAIQIPGPPTRGHGNRWAALAKRYREQPSLLGKSENLNDLVREFRDEFSL